jgi:hypothetical protein
MKLTHLLLEIARWLFALFLAFLRPFHRRERETPLAAEFFKIFSAISGAPGQA